MVTFTKKKKIAIGATALVLIGGGTAFAYWTGGGTGTGSAGTGTSAGVVVVQTSTVVAMGPGVAAQGLSGDFNNTSDGPVYVGTVTASISSVTPVGAGLCDATDYTLTNPDSTVNAEVPVGTGVGSWGTTDTPMIAFNNKTGVNQDGCKNATVQISYAVS
jgi:hypothetical protein